MNDGNYTDNTYHGLTRKESKSLKNAAHASTYSSMAKVSRKIVLKKCAASEDYIVKELSACHEIWSNLGKSYLRNQVIAWVTEASASSCTPYRDNWEDYLSKYLFIPEHIRNPLFYIIYHAAVDAQTKFSLENSAPMREEMLSGGFITSLRESLYRWNDAAYTYLHRVGASVEMSCIDFQVGGLETPTGGDFLLILEVDDSLISKEDEDENGEGVVQKPKGVIIVPMIFQAKRYELLSADISRKSKKSGHQYEALGRNNCSSAYIFFNSGKANIKYPAPPMVKPVEYCEHPSKSEETAVFEKSVDFSTYLLQAMSGHPSFKYAENREEALSMIKPSIDSGRLNTVAVLSSKPGAGRDFSKILEEMILNESQKETDSPEDSGFDPS